jgi:hypothetical protein
MIVKENGKEYVCHYGHRFLGKDVKLVAFRNESKELLGHIMFVKSEDDEYYKGGRPEEGYLLACPQCGIIQMGGFICPADKTLDPTKAEELKRRIELKL